LCQPKAFLKETLHELTEAQRAALTVTFLFRSRLPAHTGRDDRISLVCDKFGVKQGDVNDALVQLDGSFILQKPDGSARIWTFAHPTIADALAEILRDRPDLLELYIQGARVEVLLAEATCEGAAEVPDAIVIPASSNELLVVRIVEMADEATLNKILFGFLATRASDVVLREVVAANPDIVRRKSGPHWRVLADGRIMLFARLHQLRLLSEDLREEVADELERALLYNQDSTVLDHEDVLALFSPRQLLALSMKIYEDLVSDMPSRIEGLVGEADLTIEPSDNFDELKHYVHCVESAFSDVSMVADAVASVESAIGDAITRVTERKEDENESTEWVGEDITPKVVTAPASGRSIFSDVDL